MTYSIVARCEVTGQLGVAVQSHFFSTGSVVPWAESGVGAVATQATAEIAHGPDVLAQVRAGRGPAAALATVLGADPHAEVRQVAVVDGTGQASAHTGSRCIAHASHVTGDGFSAQANMMHAPGVPEAMAAAFAAHDGSLVSRLLEALDAAEAAGGDIRGRQSAALLVLSGTPPTRPAHDRLVDVRVDDHPDPLVELRRLADLSAVYRAMEDADDAMARGDLDTALGIYEESAERRPELHELTFWHAVMLVGAGRVEAARTVASPVFARPDGERWRELVRRLPATGLLPPAAAGSLLEPIEGPSSRA
jgi:uncharacterized Ntn-hydrolase superfamily protein